MGWTWSGSASSLLNLYPTLADSTVMLNQWPGFKETVDEMRQKGLLPQANAVPPVAGELEAEDKPLDAPNAPNVPGKPE